MQKQVIVKDCMFSNTSTDLQVGNVVHIGGISHWAGTIAPTYTYPPNAVQRFGMAQGRRRGFSWLRWLFYVTFTLACWWGAWEWVTTN